jgi:hypothetical protein
MRSNSKSTTASKNQRKNPSAAFGLFSDEFASTSSSNVSGGGGGYRNKSRGSSKWGAGRSKSKQRPKSSYLSY